MAKNFKKAFSVFLAMALLTVLVAGVALSASASWPAEFFSTWTGEGDVSVHLGVDHTKFDRLDYNHGEVDSSNYTVTGTDNSAVITLKESYLKTLSNRNYDFWIHFSDVLRKHAIEFYDADAPNEATIETLYGATFVKITYGDEEVDPSNYVITTYGGSDIVITFTEEYLQTLTGESSLWAYFVENYIAILCLDVDVKPTLTTVVTTTFPDLSDDLTTTGTITETEVSVLQTTTTAVTTTTPDLSDEPPKTGDIQSIGYLFIIMLLSSVSCIVLIKKEHLASK